MSCDLDLLCMGPFVLRKRDQPAWVPPQRGEPTVDILDHLLSCPCGSRSRLQRDRDVYRAGSCGHEFHIADGIPQLFWPHDIADDPTDVTRRVKAFYEQTPFPNYDECDSIRTLVEKARRGKYARALDEAIPYNSQVLEVGCGTGQLSNFLGTSCRRVIGTDLSLNSLRLAECFRRDHGLSRVRFVQANLFQTPFDTEQFDVVLCNGVLHHTSNPRRGFKTLVSLLRPGGYIVVGLYNRYGRLMTDVRRQVFRATRGAGQWLDPYLRSVTMSDSKRVAWFVDQYRHPHESTHTIGEVLHWFAEAGLEFVRSVPSVNGAADDGASLFTPSDRGSAWDHFQSQARHIVTGSREGGFFIMVGRRPASSMKSVAANGFEGVAAGALTTAC